MELELQGDPKGLHMLLEFEPKSPPKELYLKVDGQVIVWDIMRPLLNKLPEPNILLSEADNTDYVPSKETDNYDHKAAILHSFLSSQIFTVLKREETYHYIPNIETWLETLPVGTLYNTYTKMNKNLDMANCFLTQTNDVLAACTGSSTNAIFLGSSQQSCAALYYITKYVTKTKVARGNCLLALAASLNAITKYPSRAKDSGTDKRSAQHLLTKVHNALFRHAEISHTQAALTLLGTSSEIASTNFAYFSAKHMVAGIQAELKQHAKRVACNTTSVDSNPSNDSSNTPYADNMQPPKKKQKTSANKASQQVENHPGIPNVQSTFEQLQTHSRGEAPHCNASPPECGDPQSSLPPLMQTQAEQKNSKTNKKTRPLK